MVRRIRRIRLYAVAVVMAGVAVVAQLSLAILGFALVWHSDALTVGVDLGTTPSWSSIALALSLATLAYTGLETITNFAAEVREPGPHAAAHACSWASARVVVLNVAVSMVGVSAYPVEPTPGAPDGVAGGLATEWLQAPLLGIATAIGDELPGGGAWYRGARSACPRPSS